MYVCHTHRALRGGKRGEAGHKSDAKEKKRKEKKDRKKAIKHPQATRYTQKQTQRSRPRVYAHHLVVELEIEGLEAGDEHHSCQRSDCSKAPVQRPLSSVALGPVVGGRLLHPSRHLPRACGEAAAVKELGAAREQLPCSSLDC